MRPLQSSDLNKVAITAMHLPMSGVNTPVSLRHRTATPLSRNGGSFPAFSGGSTFLWNAGLWHAGCSQTFTAIWGCTAIWGFRGAGLPDLHENVGS